MGNVVTKTDVRMGPIAEDGRALRAAGVEYQARLSERSAALERRNRLERRVADARLGVFTLGLVVLASSYWSKTIGWYWTLVPIAGYVGLVVWHERIRKATHRASRAVEFYAKGVGRVEGTWPGSGVAGDRFLKVEHPYAADLDLFGRGSLFERLCTARTRAGEETLAAWLLGPASPEVIRARQEAVEELRTRLDLREDLELLGADVREGIDPEALASWGREPREFSSRSTSVFALVLGAIGLATLAIWAFTNVGPTPLLVIIIVDVVVSIRQKPRVERVVDAIQKRTKDLLLLAALLERLERETFRSRALIALGEALRSEGEPASRSIARLARWLQFWDAKDNQFFTPIAGLLRWSTQVAIAIDGWRTRTGPEIAGWLGAVGAFEALSSLAAFAYENPEAPFPEIVEAETWFEGTGIGHPLISGSTRVTNDLRLGGELRALLISGSNMSGKSTLLRTVGTNIVLALAGAPVCARSLKVSVLAIGATLRIQDSLQAGKSRFYAEITRIRELVDLAGGDRPLFFLLDEVFHGTNSHDRVTGAGSVVKGLIGKGAIGLVTTHDLALAEVAETLAPKAVNVHFEDQFVNGEMTFDYRMRPGVVTHSNALALMRAVGLDV